jgi:16S rRNA A1518/A1519 N6-dimethyltransferase RsmA/KsgA/DIM1 with predicted DNA glycosylase/AP lyase activity
MIVIEPRDPEGFERRVIHRLIRFAGRHVLEIGSGDGRLTWRYTDRAASVLELDPDEAAGASRP